MEKVKVFIVEDEKIVAIDIKHRLYTLDYDVMGISTSGEECIKMLETIKPDIILMDIVLKGTMDGITTADIIRKKFHIPVIFLTAHTDEKTIQRAKLTEPFGYLIKPFEVKDLQSTIEIAIYKYQIESRLIESELKYRTLVGTATDAIVIIDEFGFVNSFNTKALKMFGYTDEEFTGMAIKKILPDVFINHLQEGVKKFLEVGKNVTADLLELTAKTKINKIFPIEISFSQWQAENKSYFTCIIRDITIRRATENALKLTNDELERRVRERTAELTSLVEQSPLGIRIFNSMGNLEYLNGAWEEMWGQKREEFTEKFKIFEEPLLVKLGYGESLKMVFKNGGYFKTKPLFFDLEDYPDLKKKHSVLLTFHFYAVLNEKGDVFRVINLVEDITDRMKAQEVNVELEQRKGYTALFINEIEEERVRIARELHDSIGQMLSAIKFNIELTEKSLKDNDPNLQISKQILSKAGKELKEIIYSLHPSFLENSGLKIALTNLVEEFREKSSIEVNNILIDIDMRLEQTLELAIYRIFQEALNNIVKHSFASFVKIYASIKGNMFIAIIRDNGCGFNVEETKQSKIIHKTYGLVNMRERAEMFGGTFNIESSNTTGTEIFVEIPIKEIENND